MAIEIRIDDLSGSAIEDLIRVHSETMLALSPAESCHFLSLDELKHPSVTTWTLWENGVLVGCGALQDQGDGTGEIKSMHTLAALRGRGLGRSMLEHILAEARARGYAALYLETGSMAGFMPARRLYEAYGFDYCEPFGAYRPDPNSVFMRLALTDLRS